MFLDAVKQGGAKAAGNLKTSYAPDQVKTAVQTARYLLTATGRYAEAADLLSGVDADTQAHAAADALRQVHRMDPASLKPDTPEHLVEAFDAAEYDPDESMEQLRGYWSKLIPEKDLDRVFTLWRRFVWMGATAQDIPPWVERDTNLSMVKKTVEQNGDDYRVRQFAGSRREWLGVISEDGHLRILGNAAIPDGIGRRAIALAKAGKLDRGA